MCLQPSAGGHDKSRAFMVLDARALAGVPSSFCIASRCLDLASTFQKPVALGNLFQVSMFLMSAVDGGSSVTTAS
jgi:hypothetical protein